MILLAEATYTLGQIFTGVLLLAGIAAVICLIIVLCRIASTLKNVNKLISDNSKNIDATIKKLPELMNNTNETIANVKDITGVADDVISDVGGLVDSFASPEGPSGVIASVAGAVVSVIQVIKEISDKK